MATALPDGNLIVPVLHHADQFNIIGLTKQVNRLANNARAGKLQPSDTQNGTFTFTNIGTFGSLMGTPIINQPQVAILAIGAIKKKPVVIETDQGDSVGIRHMMFVSMSYDHRIIDGSLGSIFLNEFVKCLGEFDPSRDI
jgi:2-oxoglutarate dehydrogenase E2 component (dihydrolipoamide succinyltransferase)